MHTESKFFNDEYLKVFAGGDVKAQIEFLEEIDEIEKEDTKWITMPLSELSVMDIGLVGPLFAPQMMEEKDVYGNSLDAVLSTITDGSEMGYVKGSQFMMGRRNDVGKVKWYLMSQKGFVSLANMVGSSCPAFFRRPNNKKEEELNFDLTTVGKKEIKVQIVGNKVQACHAAWYNILKKNKMLYGITDILDEKYPDYEFLGGYYSHSGLMAKWALPDQADEILKLYSDAVDKRKTLMDFSDAVPVIRFYTSDVGESTASIGAYLEKENHYSMKIGNVVKTYHKGKSTEQDVINACEGLFAQFRDMVEAMTALLDIQIENPINSILNVGLQACGLSKIQLTKSVEEFKSLYGEEPENMTANDVFIVLQRALNDMRLTKKFSETKIEDSEEALMKLLSPHFSWEAYDTSVVIVNGTSAE